MENTLSIGTKVTLCHYCGSETPYTVTAVKGNRATIQECLLLFRGVRYYDTIADKITENPNGRTKTIYLNKHGRWSVSGDKYYYVSIGEWCYLKEDTNWNCAVTLIQAEFGKTHCVSETLILYSRY